MPGHQLPLEVVRALLDDAREAGIDTVRLYGGEPLLHPELPQIVAHSVEGGLSTYVTTNGSLLAKRFGDLFAAGLRFVTVGLYGTGTDYDGYVQKPGAFRRLERGLMAVRERHGDEVEIRLNWLLMRPSCNRRSLDAALEFARRLHASLQIDLVHYSLPYFTEGRDGRLQFRPGDRPEIEEVVHRLIRVKRARSLRIEQSELALRSIPDWLLEGPGMRVPCDKYRMLWIGADGTVQLCYVKFVLGNLHETRLRDILYGAEHTEAARRAFQLDCPNCHCGYDQRTRKHTPSRRRYRRVATNGERSAV
jgi:cyclic pyranopterin phosphate synthase